MLLLFCMCFLRAVRGFRFAVCGLIIRKLVSHFSKLSNPGHNLAVCAQNSHIIEVSINSNKFLGHGMQIQEYMVEILRIPASFKSTDLIEHMVKQPRSILRPILGIIE
jgi:hypothetical protein